MSRRPLPRTRPHLLALAAAAALGPMVVSPALADTCTWSPASGNWNTAAAWSCGHVPGGGDTVVINTGTQTVTINNAGGQAALNLTNKGTLDIDAYLLTLAGGGSTTNTGTINVGAGAIPNNAALNISAGHNVNNAGGVINVSADSVVNQFGSTISGGTINTTGTGKLVAFSSSSNFLSGLTLNGTLDAITNANARERIINGITFGAGSNVNIGNGGIVSLDSTATSGGNQTIAGSGTFNLNDAGARLAIEGSGTTTLGAGVTVRGQGNFGQAVVAGGNNVVVNNGRISADVSGATLALVPPANGGGSSITNNGVLDARNGGVLSIQTNVANGGGLINAQNGSTVVLGGVSVTGGTLGTAGSSGLIQAASSSNNFLDSTTANGTLDLTGIVNARLRVVNALALNGAVNVANGGILTLDSANSSGNAVNVSGSGTINLNDPNARLSIEGSGATTLGAGVTVRGQGNIGTPIYAGGNNTLLNNGTILADGGTLTIALPANGGGSSLSGAGTLQVNGGTLNLATGKASQQGKLVIGATGSFATNNQNLTLSGDYTNVQAGSGNGFNRRAGVTGTGQILAGGDVAQAIFGTGVTGGNTANATMTIGNVRVGANTFNYQIGNTGTTGPTLRGAIQTTAGGGNLTDGRLSGTGVTASNYSAGVPGSNSGNLAVTFTAASAGALAPLAGQVLNLRSNFENIADQKLNIVLAGGAAAYNAAVGSAAPTPIVIGNQRVGGSVSQALTVSNTAAAGNYSEDLSASFGNNTGAATNNAGTLAAVLAGSSNAAAMKVGVDTTSSGAKSGTVTLNYATTGAVNGVANNLGPASAGTQTINVSGNVYQAAAGQLQGNTLNFGTLQVGQNVSQDLVVRNTASGAAGFVEDLNASFGASGNSQITGSGALNGILAGTNSTAANGTMKVTVTGATAGALNSGIAVNYQSAGAVGGASNGLGTLAVGSEQFNVNGTITALANVINQASPQLNTPTLNLGAVRVGAASPTGTVSVTNVATAAPQAALNASITPTSGPISAGGSFNLLAPGATDAASLVVGLNTGTAGNFTGVNAGKATIAFVSDANNVGGCAPNCQLNLASQVVNVEGKVYTAAAGQLNAPGSINFGTVRVGTALGTQTVTIANVAVASALNDTLTGTMAVSGAGFSGNGASIAGLAAGGPTGSMQIGMDTSSAGVKNGSAKVGFISHNPDISDLVLADSQSVALAGTVNALADPMFSKTAGAANFSCSGGLCTLNMGTLLQGSGTASSTLKLTNAAAGPADDLTGSFDFTGFSGFGDSGFGPVSLAAGMDMLGLTLSLDTSALGSFSSGFTFNGFSHNAFQSDYALNAIRFLVEGVVVAQGGGNVPEPATLWLVLAAGAGGLAARRRAQRRAH